MRNTHKTLILVGGILCLISPYSANLFISSSVDVANRNIQEAPRSLITANILYPATVDSADLYNRFLYDSDTKMVTGYYGDLLTHLENLSSIEFNYIIPKDIDEWQSMTMAFLNGEDYTDADGNATHIDIVPNAAKDYLVGSIFEENLLFSTGTDCEAPLYLVTQKDNLTISEFDFETYRGARVGLLTGAKSRNKYFTDWATQKGLYGDGVENPMTITYCETMDIRDMAFRKKDVDIVIDEYSIGYSEARTLATITNIDSYLAFSKNSNEAIYTGVNSALESIHSGRTTFLDDLLAKYFPTHYAQIVLNETERSFLKGKNKIVFGYPGDHYPFIFKDDDGKLTGFIPKYFDYLVAYFRETYGFESEFEYLIPEGNNTEVKQKIYDGDIDIWWGRSDHHKPDPNVTLFDTYSYINIDIRYIVNIKNSSLSLSEAKTVGAANSDFLYDAISQLAEGQLKRYRDQKQLVSDLNDGLIDGALCTYSFYKYARYTMRYDNLVDSAIMTSSNICFVTSPNAFYLHSALNKCIHNMTSSGNAESLYSYYDENYNYTVNFQDLLLQNLPWVTIILVVFIALMAALTIVMIFLFNNRKKQAKLFKNLSETDPMVKIYNKKVISNITDEYMMNGIPFALYMIDINDFKSINDAYGHVAGDRVLIEIGRRLMKFANPNTTPARFGGDEFVIISTDIDKTNISSLCKKLLDTTPTPIEIDKGQTLKVGFSIGVASYPENGKTLDEVLIASDDALYAVKEKKFQIGYAIYDSTKTYNHQKEAVIKAYLTKAINENRVYMVYQPIIDIVDKKVSSVEALMRIKDYNVSPAEFIPVAEKTGLMVNLGRIALEQSILFAGKMKRDGINAAVSINVSGAQIQDNQISDYVTKLMSENNVKVEDLIFEMTESSMFNTKNRTEWNAKVKDKGIRLAMDDFGTGYSALSSLSEYPYEIIKFDKSIADQLENRPFVNELFTFVKGYGYKILAEGVENKNQLDILKSNGVRYIQGYYFSKPLDEDKAIEFIKNFKMTD